MLMKNSGLREIMQNNAAKPTWSADSGKRYAINYDKKVWLKV
jgi:hypothetical protein